MVRNGHSRLLVRIYFPPCALVTVQDGELVWAWHEETGDLALKPVLQTLVREADALVELQVGANTVQATPEHPFWANGAWTNAGDLVKGDELLRSDGLAMLGVDFNGSNYCQLEDIGCACTFRGAMPLAQAAV